MWARRGACHDVSVAPHGRACGNALQVDESKLTDDQRKGFPTKGGTSKPLFVLYKSRVAVAKVQGANAPELEAAILENMPPLSSVE